MKDGPRPGEGAQREGGRAVSWLIAFAVVGLVAWAGSPAFEGIDDVAILRHLEHGLEAPFIATALSRALAFLYREVAPTVPWFGLVLLGAHALALGLALDTARRLPLPRWIAGAAAALYAVLQVNLLLQLSYNSASILLTANALTAFLVRTAGDAPPARGTLLALGAALAGGYLVRVDGFGLAGLMLAPLLAAAAWRGRPWRRAGPARGRGPVAAWACLAWFLAPAAVAIAADRAAPSAAISDAHRRFTEFNRMRGAFMDRPASLANTNNAALMKQLGWSANDYLLMTSWTFFDETVYGPVVWRRIRGAGVPVSLFPGGHVARTLNKLRSRYGFDLWLIGLSLAGAALAGAPREAGWRAAYAAYALGVGLTLALVYQFPPRVGHPALLAAGAALFVRGAIGGVPRRDGHPRWRRGAAAALAVAVAAVGLACVARTARRSLDNRADRGRLGAAAVVLRSLPPETLFIVEPAAGVRWESMHPLEGRRTYPENVLPIGWSTYSPLYDAVLSRHGFGRGSEILPAAVAGAPVAFVIRHPRYAGLLEAYVREHLGREVRLRPRGELPFGAAIYRVEVLERRAVP